MSADINNFTGTGRIGKDVKARHTTGNKSTAVCDVSVAMTVGWGERQSTVWIRLTVWGKQAEFLGQYAQKGDLVIWSGAIFKIDEYQDSNGEKKKTHYFEIGQSGMVNLVSKQRQDSSHDGEPTDADERNEPPADDGNGPGW